MDRAIPGQNLEYKLYWSRNCLINSRIWEFKTLIKYSMQGWNPPEIFMFQMDLSVGNTQKSVVLSDLRKSMIQEKHIDKNRFDMYTVVNELIKLDLRGFYGSHLC